MRGLKFVLLIVAAAGGYYAYTHYRGGAQAPAGAHGGGAAPVSVAEVILREVRPWQEFSGRLVAVDRAEIRPQVSGLISAVHFKEGERVKKGQRLFTIDQRPYRAALDAAQARLTLAQSELERARKLMTEKAMPQREYDQRKNAAEVAKADYAAAKLNFDYTTIDAPVSGRVSRAELTVGNLVKADNPALLTTVVADKPIYADFDIDEQSYLQSLRPVGTDAAKLRDVPVKLGLSGEEGTPHEGRMQSIDNQLNVASGTIRARAVFANEDGMLIPGLFARIALGGAAKEQTILISERAVGTDQNKKFVLVLGAENKVEYRPVVLGGLADGLRIVREGLKPGEKIVVNGLQRAQPGSAVTPEVVGMEAKDQALGTGH